MVEVNVLPLSVDLDTMMARGAPETLAISDM